jgi:hypothetical protein
MYVTVMHSRPTLYTNEEQMHSLDRVCKNMADLTKALEVYGTSNEKGLYLD